MANVIAEGTVVRSLAIGNEAIARGRSAGIDVMAAYPGTPSSETLRPLLTSEELGFYVEWSTNESRIEVAAGASLVGARSMVAMKMPD